MLNLNFKLQIMTFKPLCAMTEFIAGVHLRNRGIKENNTKR